MGEKSNSELMDELLTEMEAMLPQLEAHVERLEKAFAKLEADNKRLREALEGVLPFAEIVIASTDSEHDRDHLRRARAALKETDDDT